MRDITPGANNDFLKYFKHYDHYMIDKKTCKLINTLQNKNIF